MNSETNWSPETVQPEQLSSIIEFREYVPKALSEAVSTCFDNHVLDSHLKENIEGGVINAIEVGAGLGGFSKIASGSKDLFRISNEMTHYEWNKSFIGEAERQGYLERYGSAYDLPEASDSQDICLYFSSMDTLDFGKALEEAKRVTKQGGKIVIINDLSPDPGPIREAIKREGNRLLISDDDLKHENEKTNSLIKARQFDYIKEEDFLEFLDKKREANDYHSISELNKFYESIINRIDPFAYFAENISLVAKEKSLTEKFNGYVKGYYAEKVEDKKEKAPTVNLNPILTIGNSYSLIKGIPKVEVISGLNGTKQEVEVQLIVLEK